MFRGLGFGVQGLGFRVCGLGLLPGGFVVVLQACARAS